MKKIVGLLSVALCFGTLSGQAMADTLKFLGSSSDIGPYQMQVEWRHQRWSVLPG